MTTFLERILATKRDEVAELRRQNRLGKWPDVNALPPCRGFAHALQKSPSLSVIAEVKQASPSKGQIATDFHPVAIARTYEQAGAAAVSVLTDTRYFQGSITDLRRVHEAVALPVLRKDFIIDEIQVREARIAGADAVLLIVAALSEPRLRELSAYAKSLGLDVLIEVHAEEELPAALSANPSVLGINNRNLHTFHVDLNTTVRLRRQIPDGVPTISESGVHSRADAERLAASGVCGLLVGESLMRQETPERVRELMKSLQVPRFAVAKGGAGK
ncbi:indole-3-glycerol phosphate synthase TrpC [Alicyclobacillus herbarius]|uniref:indole-3-glycerol phosphate synthase TrpC n=1 Tax=Alicyclobacillus herbarius TaxID=122960 RepID=UPI00041A7AAE|nr:indole-3-glycerol phosphate synthase TrpC [Alicyclobacillus herbarius]